MEAGNTDDLLDYLKLDPDHHEKIASLIPQVGVEAWQVVTVNITRRGNALILTFGSGDLVRGPDTVRSLHRGNLPDGLYYGE